jgi:hypothetical protein
MRIITTIWLAGLVLIAPVDLVTAPSAAQTAPAAPSGIQIPPAALNAPLAAEYRQMISQYLDTWAGQMRQADRAAVLELRNQLAARFGQYDSVNYRLPFAQLAAQKLVPLLDLKDALKQVNVAIALSQMDQVSIQPALGKMVAHPNAAVRFFGWQGYERIRMLVLAQGPTFIQQMFDALQTAAANEPSDGVLRAIYPVLAYDQERPTFVAPEVYDEASRRALELLGQLWQRQCDQVEQTSVSASVQASVSAVRAAQVGIRELHAIAQARQSDRAAQLAVLPLVVAMMNSAAKAYQTSGAEGLAADELRLLLRDIEETVNLITRLRQNYLGMALSGNNPLDRAQAVERAARTWVDQLKGSGYLAEPASQAG